MSSSNVPADPQTFKELGDAVRDQACEEFVDNECGSDEYRECQPEKGIMFIAEWASLHADAPREEFEPMIDMILTWMNAWRNKDQSEAYPAYAGADELRPILTKYFLDMWEADRHPYYQSVEELLDLMDDLPA